MRKVLLIAAIVLAACGSQDGDSTPEWTKIRANAWWNDYYAEIPLPDGRVIPCIYHEGGYDGGLSCDWSER